MTVAEHAEERAAARKSSALIVFEAIQDLYAREQIVTRETLREVTGLTLVVIDDRLSYLADNGRIRRVQRGVYVPVAQHRPARVITRTLLPDGTNVLEIGDTVLHLTPRESRFVGELMAGAGQQYSAIEIGHQNEFIAAELAARVRALERENRALAQDHDAAQRALGLEGDQGLPL